MNPSPTFSANGSKCSQSVLRLAFNFSQFTLFLKSINTCNSFGNPFSRVHLPKGNNTSFKKSLSTSINVSITGFMLSMNSAILAINGLRLRSFDHSTNDSDISLAFSEMIKIISLIACRILKPLSFSTHASLNLFDKCCTTSPILPNTVNMFSKIFSV